jgi:excisionase family DNA binding protein
MPSSLLQTVNVGEIDSPDCRLNMAVMYTPPQVAKQMGVNADKVLNWIRSGELEAFNAAARPDSQRPRYRVTDEALQAFIKRRTVVQRPKVFRRRKKPPTLAEVKAMLAEPIERAREKSP